MKLKSNGWNFLFDKEATERYYQALNDQLCDCAMCRNFYLNADKIPAELRVFLEQFGIDVAKPIEQWSNMADKENMCVNHTLYYSVEGHATSQDGYEIDIGPISILIESPKEDDAVKSPENSPNVEISEPYFVFTVFNLWLPWVIEDSIDDCYPEKKSFFKALFSSIKRK
jgi:hypothetical protein